MSFRYYHPAFGAATLSFWLLTTAATDASSPRVTIDATRLPPSPTGIDFDADIGHQHRAADFVKKWTTTSTVPYTVEHSFPVPTASGGSCELKFSAATGSSAIPKHDANTDNRNNYFVGLIRNPNQCALGKLQHAVDANHSIAIFVWFSQQTDPTSHKYGEQEIGKPYVVIVDNRAVDVDVALNTPIGSDWTLGQCGHQTDRVDRAIMFLNRGDAYATAPITPDPDPTVKTQCDQVDKFHWSAPAASRLLKSTYSKTSTLSKTKSYSLVALATNTYDSLGFWFACGADCCYVDMNQ